MHCARVSSTSVRALLAGTSVLALLSGCSPDPPAAPTSPSLQRAEATLQQRKDHAAWLRQAIAREREDRRLRALEASAPRPEPPPKPRPEPREPVRRSAERAPRVLLSAADRRSFSRLARALGGRSGLAVSPVGLDQPVGQLGSLRTGVAWSTSKVPVAMAVVAAGRAGDHGGDLRRAVTASDNAAAERLWAALGGGAAAAGAAEEQLRRAGDEETHVEARRLRTGFTAFGQTRWSLTEQARLVAAMPCSSPGRRVLTLMEDVVPAQRWGLGAVGARVAVKGGWGPGTEPGLPGGYLERQMGLLVLDGRQVAVAVAHAPADRSHTTGTLGLTAIARWLATHLDPAAGTRPGTESC